METVTALTLDSTVHLIQVSLTPVFLLSGIAALLNVFASRLARVADRLDMLAGRGAGEAAEASAITGPGAHDDKIARLHRRSLVLDVAVVLGTLAAAATCLAITALFVLALTNIAIPAILLISFGVAVLCTLGSVAAFGLEMLMSSKALRLRMHLHVPSLKLFGR